MITEADELNTEYGVATDIFVFIMSDTMLIESATMLIDGVQSIDVLKTLEKVRPFVSVQNSSKLSYVNLVESNNTLKLVPLFDELIMFGVDEPDDKIEHESKVFVSLQYPVYKVM